MTTVQRQASLAVDWRRVGRRSLIAALVVVGTIELYRYAGAGHYGFDFRGGAWHAGWDVLHGRNPYPPPDASLLRPPQHAFFTPPLLAVIAVPFSLLPFGPAIVLWNLMCVAAFVGALRVLGVKDLRLYALALFSVPLIDSLESGQPDALFALAAAVAWRYRERDLGAVAAGALIAAKIVAWPLVIWLLVTRRFRSFGVSIASAVALLLGSWACIGFQGFMDYPKLLAADSKAVEGWRFVYSLTHGLIAAGASSRTAGVLTIVIAIGAGLITVALARGSDAGWFAAALTVGLLASPILWLHYLVLVFVPLAIAQRRALGIWVAAGYGFWLLLIVSPPGGLRAFAVCATATLLAAWATSRRGSSSAPDYAMHGQPGTLWTAPTSDARLRSG